MRRDIFTSDHDAFRDAVRSFIAKEVAPYHDQWERDGVVSRDVWLAAGEAGLLGIDVDERHGGGGNDDYRYYLVLNEEMAPCSRPPAAARRALAVGGTPIPEFVMRGTPIAGVAIKMRRLGGNFLGIPRIYGHGSAVTAWGSGAAVRGPW